MVRIGQRKIGDGQPCFITFEAGATHDGVESAKRLVNLAAEAGADAIKFQIFDPDKLVADKQLPFTYEVLVDRETGRTEAVTEPLYDILCRRYLTADQWRQVKSESENANLAFFATVGFEEDIALLEELGCDSIKIASADVNHWPLIRRAAESGACLQLDTGNAALGEIEKAVDVVSGAGNESIIIHNCPSGYPARLDSINLNLIKTLKQMFPYPVAYSDHTPGWEMDIAAVAVGANLVEKTITLDRMTRSCEHQFSLEPADMKRFVEMVRAIETALGSPRRILHPEEIKKRTSIRRSAFLSCSGAKGEPLSSLRIEYRRPGFGLGPDIVEDLATLRLRRDLPAGHMLSWSDLEAQ